VIYQNLTRRTSEGVTALWGMYQWLDPGAATRVRNENGLWWRPPTMNTDGQVNQSPTGVAVGRRAKLHAHKTHQDWPANCYMNSRRTMVPPLSVGASRSRNFEAVFLSVRSWITPLRVGPDAARTLSMAAITSWRRNGRSAKSGTVLRSRLSMSAAERRRKARADVEGKALLSRVS